MNKLPTILTAAALAFAATVSWAADFYVSPNGNDANPGTQTQPFATLDLRETTFADRMKRAGYIAGALGKWRLGAGGKVITAAEGVTPLKPSDGPAVMKVPAVRYAFSSPIK